MAALLTLFPQLAPRLHQNLNVLRFGRSASRASLQRSNASAYAACRLGVLSREKLRRISESCSSVNGFSGVKSGLFAICSP